MPDLQEIADRIAIRDVTERYTVAVTRRAWDEMADCFHVDSRWQVTAPMEMDFNGRDAIRTGISSAVATSDFLVQMTHSAIIETLSVDRATQTVVLNEIGRNTEQQTGFNLLGIYTDTLTKIDDRWRFERRIFQPHYLDMTWLPGQVMVDYAANP